MWTIDAEELIKRLTELKDAKDPDDPVDRAIMVGLDRAITEVCLMPRAKED